MKLLFIALVFFFLNNSYCEGQCISYYSLDKRINISIYKNTFTIMVLPNEIITHEDGSDNNFEGEEVFSSKDYKYKGNLLFVYKNENKYCFKVINGDILYATSNLTNYVKKGDKFYCDSYQINKGIRLSGGDWKNDKMEGKWYYRAKNEFSILTYKQGEIIKKELIYMNKPTIPSYRVYPIPSPTRNVHH